jgi:hypothetical protein
MIGKNTYLKCNWARLDFLIVFISILDIVFENLNLEFFKVNNDNIFLFLGD